MALPKIKYLIGQPIDDAFDRFGDSAAGVIQPATRTRLVVETADGLKTVFKGSFTVSGGVVTGGTVTGYDTYVGKTKVLKAKGFSYDALDVVAALDAAHGGSFAAFNALFHDSGVKKKIVGSDGGDTIVATGQGSIGIGGRGGDSLVGDAKKQVLKGGPGNDLVIGRGGADELYGGPGNDVFYFSESALASKGTARIKDFKPSKDQIQLLVEDFVGVPAGRLDDSQFHVGKAAKTAEQVVIYNRKKGVVYYDPDGSGPEAQIKFLKLSKGLALSADDFYGWV